jgi:hypothetical protein
LFFLFGLDEHLFGDDAGTQDPFFEETNLVFPSGTNATIANLAEDGGLWAFDQV